MRERARCSLASSDKAIDFGFRSGHTSQESTKVVARLFKVGKRQHKMACLPQSKVLLSGGPRDAVTCSQTLAHNRKQLDS